MAKTQEYGSAADVAPESHTVLLDNDRVRVIEYRMGPGEKADMHSHPDGIVYNVAGRYKARSTSPDGKAQEFDIEPGMCIFSPAQAHIFENLGPEEGRGIHVELK